ncbi:hypothetical protein Gotri_006106 [Gossypium trilobum]|uniref:Uncharacterized protein n=2 Tax=Gossypium TaxID=3633 RepID=A0A7J9EYT6_9ROSI|nr:hypothetical protein [Gossypium trilobum]
MKAYIKPIGEKAWHSILTGYEPPMMNTKNGRVAKPEIQWTPKEECLANVDSKALYAIFYGVYLQEFKRTAKWTISKTT